MEKKLLLQKPILKFLVLRGKKEELLAYIFGIYIKFEHENLLDLADVASYPEWLVPGEEK